MDKIIIYADGACRGNQFKENIGAYGIIIVYKNHKKELYKAFKNVTNNQMEILAVIEALRALKRYDIPVSIYSDSQYVINTLLLGWRKNANIDLWNQLDAEINKVDKIEFFKVKGHADSVYNNRADELANIAMDNFKEK